MIGKLGLMPTPPCLGELSLLREGGGIPSVCECVCPKKYQSSQCLKYQIFFNFSIIFTFTILDPTILSRTDTYRDVEET